MTVFQIFKDSGSFISWTGLLAYGLSKIRKRFAKPELGCHIELVDTKFLPINTNRGQDKYGGVIEDYSGQCTIKQYCKFSITNISEHTAIKLRVVKVNQLETYTVNWKPMPNYTIPIITNQIIEQSISISVTMPYDEQRLFDDNDMPKGFLCSELVIEYQNLSGKKFNLIFHPNEKDMEKRNTCVRV